MLKNMIIHIHIYSASKYSCSHVYLKDGANCWLNQVSPLVFCAKSFHQFVLLNTLLYFLDLYADQVFCLSFLTQSQTLHFSMATSGELALHTASCFAVFLWVTRVCVTVCNITFNCWLIRRHKLSRTFCCNQLLHLEVCTFVKPLNKIF